MSAITSNFLRSSRIYPDLIGVFQASLLVFALVAIPLSARSEPNCGILDTGSPYPEYIAINADQQGVVESKVTFIFPHTGFRLEWGDLEVADRRFSVALDWEELDAGWQVVAECSNTYSLGPLADGAYVFEVYDFAGNLREAKRFFIVDGKPQGPPVPADVLLDSRPLESGVEIEAQVRFLERGYAIASWGDPEVGDGTITIEAEAVRRSDSTNQVRFNRHTYAIHDLDHGEYSVRFLLKGHEMADHVFTVEDHSWRTTVRLFTESITDHRTAGHSLQVDFRHPDGIDTDSFGHRDLRVTGPENFARHARFVEWTHSMDAAWPNGVIATYEIDPPGGFWTAEENGRYAVFLQDGAVKSGGGEPLSGRRIGEFDVRLERPAHPLVRVEELELVVDHSSDTLEYGVELTLEIAHSGIQVRSWGTPESREGLFAVELDIETDEVGRPAVREESHSYSLEALPAQVFDFVVYASNVRIGSRRFAVTDDDPIRAQAMAGRIDRQSIRPFPLMVYYTSVDPLDLESIHDTAVDISGPGGYRLTVTPDEIVSNQEVNGEYRVGVLYSAPAPGGVWRAADNGYYRVSVPGRSIRDEAGRFFDGGVLSGFLVAISPPAEPPARPLVTVSRRIVDDVAFADLTFDPRDSGWSIVDWPERLHFSGTEVIAFLAIDEEAKATETQFHSFRLGKLPPGYYTFRVEGSNGFVSRHTVRISNQPPVRPIDAWRTAAGEAANMPVEERQERLSLREYAFGLDGEENGRGTILTAETVTTPDGGTRLLARYPETFSASDLNYRIEISNDLNNWVDATGLVETIEAVSDADGRIWCTIQLNEPVTHGARFLRVRAILSE